MIHRRMIFDDGRGVGEALNEYNKDGTPLSVRTKHYLSFENREKARML